MIYCDEAHVSVLLKKVHWLESMIEQAELDALTLYFYNSSGARQPIKRYHVCEF